MSKVEQRMTIKEFSSLFNKNESTIRYYERQKLLVPHRDNNNRRYFTDIDVSWFKFLMHLKGTGMSIKDIKQYVVWRAMGDSTIANRTKLLEKTKANFLNDYAQLEHHLQVLTDKINWYHEKTAGTIMDKEAFLDYLERIGHHD